MQADDPPFLSVGTDVSAKYKGAFCEAKIKKVVRNIKCKISFKSGPSAGSASTVTDEVLKGTLRVGNTVEVRQDKKEMVEAIITKIQDCSQYTVVFDDGDITTLRRSALCLKSGRHFAESETLDQLPLTHPEHFGNPVIGSSGRRGRRNNRTQSDDSDSEACDTSGPPSGSVEREPHTGRVVLVQCSGSGDKKRPQAGHWFPGLVVAPSAQDTVKIRVKEDYLVRSFKDGRYYTVPKKEAKEFRRNSNNAEWGGVEAAVQYLDKGVLPPHWDRDILFGQDMHSQSDDGDSDDSSDDEPREEKDHFVAQLYKFMDDRGTPLNRQPTIANKDIDLYRLFNVVQKLGGYNRVTNQNQWKGIANRLGFQPATNSVTNLCKQAYKKFLHSFEEFYRKLGVTLVAHPRGGRSTGRSLIRDRDKIQHSASSPAHSSTSEDKASEIAAAKSAALKAAKEKEKEREKELEREAKEKEAKELKELKELKEREAKEKEQQEKEQREREREAELKEKEAAKALKELEAREKEAKLKEKEREKEREKEAKAKEAKEAKAKELKEKKAKEDEAREKEAKEKEKEKLKEAKAKQLKEAKMKLDMVNSSDEEDSGDNQPLVPLSNSSKIEKADSPVASEKPAAEKPKVGDTPSKAKLFKSSSGVMDGKRGDKGSAKKMGHRRSSVPKCGAKDSPMPMKAEARCKSSSSDSSTAAKKPCPESSGSAKEPPLARKAGTVSATNASSSDRNDSDSSSRGSKNGKTPSRRNTPNDTPPSTPGSSSNMQNHPKKPRKRKITETSETTTLISAAVGDKLKVFYGPAQSESKVTYEAKVIEVDGKGQEAVLRVHYTGWNTRYDEWIKPSRIADNLSQKNKNKDKGRRNTPNTGTGPPESPGAKKSRGAHPPSAAPSTPTPSKPHTRNRSSSNNTTASNQPTTDASNHSDSDSECESDSSGQRGPKGMPDEIKLPKDKSASASLSSSPIDKALIEPEKDKTIKVTRVSRSPQVKRTAEGAHSRVKRSRLKQEDSDTPRGRDFDLNEIRSELKGFEKTIKAPAPEIVKLEIEAECPAEEPPIIVIKQEKTPEKVTEDIYEFKEPEPFEFEARKSEEKKKRLTTHRIFDDLPQLKLSPTLQSPEVVSLTSASSSKSPIQVSSNVITPVNISVNTAAEEDNAPKSHLDSAFDKLCESENYNVDNSSKDSVEKEGETLSLFSELAGEDSGDRLLISEAEDSQEPLFTYHKQEMFPDKSFLLFKGFTPAKNQETYSKKDATNKLRGDIDDEFTNSPVLKGEQSSDEDPIDAAIQRVNAHSMSDDSNDGELLIKTPATPTPPAGSILFPKAPEVKPVVEIKVVPKEETISKPEELIPEPAVESPKPKLEAQSSNLVVIKESSPITVKKNEQIMLPQEVIEPVSSKSSEDSDSQLDLKSESEGAASYTDVIMPEPPAFLIHKEGPSIAEKVLRAISSAKRAATPTPKENVKTPKGDAPKLTKITLPKFQTAKLSTITVQTSTESSKLVSTTDSTKLNTIVIDIAQEPLHSHKDLAKVSPRISPKISPRISPKISPRLDVKPKESAPTTVSEAFAKLELPSKPDCLPLLPAKREGMERRKSGSEPALGGKSNKVLCETIQKLSSQISQPTPALPEYQTDERSEESDSDDSDRRLIIDKLSEEESQSGISLSDSISHPPKLLSEKTTIWSAPVDSPQEQETSNKEPDSTTSKDPPPTKQPEEDSNISLLLCEETIPGSPAPENLGEGKSSSKQRSRNLEIPFASAPSISPDQQASKDQLSLKDIPHRENSRDGMRNERERERERDRERERECMGGNSNTADMVLDNTPPITPDSSLDNMSPREQQMSDGDNPNDVKAMEEENRAMPPSKKMHDIEKSSSASNLRGSAPGSPGPGGVRRGRRPRSLRASECEEHPPSSAGALAAQYAQQHRPLKYNFYVELDSCMDGAARIALLNSRLIDLRKAYHSVKAELATIDRRRKKLRRKEREAVKAAKAACS